MNPSLGEWRCSRCHTLYSFRDFMQLEMVDLHPGHPEYGKSCVCKCGAVFHRDKWHMIWNEDGYTVSTVDLQLGHHNMQSLFDERVMWYETMIMGPNGDFLSFQVRYETQQEAEDGHWQTVKMLPLIISNPNKYPEDIFQLFARAIGAVPDRKNTKKVKSIHPPEPKPEPEVVIKKENGNDGHIV